MRRAVILVALLAGCAQTSTSALDWVPGLRAATPSDTAIETAAHRAPRSNPLWVRETGLAGVTLGMTPSTVQSILGTPEKKSDTRWQYDPPRPASRLVLSFADGKLRQIQAWPPGAEETRSMVRLLDNADRVVRKYGPAPATLHWGAGEGWLYPAANVGFVVTPPDAEGDRAVDAILVGL